jgi:predicted transcriptional regulator
MGRPTGVMALTNAAKRLRAYELYMTGMQKTAIAESLGVTKAAVGNWSKKDNWDLRLQGLERRVQEQASLISQSSLAMILADMQLRLRQRVAELEALCGPTTHPATRLQAISTWFRVVKELEALAPPKPAEVPATAFVDDLRAASLVGGPDNASEQPPLPRAITND